LKQNENIEQDAATNTLYWHVANLHERESAVLSFASSALVFDDMFPLEIKFHEQYSVIGLELKDQPKDGQSGEDMSSKLTTTMKSEGYKITNE